jgi:transcriptional regulator with GAF, ATPase, and Fis domain
LGNPSTIKVDVRIIAATNRDLRKVIEEGRFREDLFYRLEVFPIVVPPLRDRKDDIPLIANSLMRKFCTRVGKEIDNITGDVIQELQNYTWPGNVRELENVIERAIITSPGRSLRLRTKLAANEKNNTIHGRKQSLADMERNYIVEILESTYWQIEGKNGAAKILGLHPNTLRGRMRKLGIKKPSPIE